jgi:hypothetical protein
VPTLQLLSVDLNAMSEDDARALMQRVAREENGERVRMRERLGCNRQYFWRWEKRLGLTHYFDEQRAGARRRFRLLD